MPDKSMSPETMSEKPTSAETTSEEAALEDLPPNQFGNGIGWGFGVLAAVVLIVIISWGWGGQGRGWGRDNQLAHMMPPAVSAANGPATRSGFAGGR
jgi:hypothetical protein